jgi:GGDEF domain-containing protein
MSAAQAGILSLRNYFSKESDPGVENPYPRIIDLFLQAIALHAVVGDQNDYERFRADIDHFADRINSETQFADLHMMVGGALKAMEDYNLRTSKFVRQQASELQTMISMLTQTVITIGADQEASAAKLGEIEKALEGASQLEDIKVLKNKLADCLKAVREEAQRQKAESQKALEALRKGLQGPAAQTGTPAPHDVDTATELPGKHQGAAALQVAADSPDGKFLLVAVVNRVQAVNARFGYAVGDRVLAAAAQHFRKNLNARDQLYRWQGPCLLGILARPHRIDQVRSEVRRFADDRLESTVELGQRSVLIPISASWSVLPVTSPVEALLKQIDAFTAAQFSRDYV